MTKTNDEKLILSETLATGEMLEAIYCSDTSETHLVVQKDGKYETVPKYVDGRGAEWLPFANDNDLLTTKFVRLPSALGEYDGPKEIYLEIRSLIGEYMKLPDDFLTVSAIYAMFTWVFDKFHTIPYLRVIGDLGTGKSRFEQVMASICYKAMLCGSSITTASVFRTIDMIGGTFVFDEADFKSSDIWSEIVKILNSGHTKDTPVVRMDVNKKDGSMTVKTFTVYGPKILASRERFSDNALESRCMTQQLLPIKNTGKPIHLDQQFEEKSLALRNKLLAFRFDMYQKIKADESTLTGIELPRLKQSALALTSMASVIGNEVLGELTNFLKKYEKELQNNQKFDIKADVLLCILDIINEDELPATKIYMNDIKMMFEVKNNEDYSDGNEQAYKKGDGTILVYPKYNFSAKKIGGCVRTLGIKTERDGRGFFIPYPQEAETIKALVERYGFEEEAKQKRNKNNAVSNEEIDLSDITF
jgi:hypothetical protein